MKILFLNNNAKWLKLRKSFFAKILQKSCEENATRKVQIAQRRQKRKEARKALALAE